jgi:YkoP domain
MTGRVPAAWWILRCGWPGHPTVGVLAVWKLWEKLELWRHGVRPVRRDGLLRYSLELHHGKTVVLADGTEVAAGARILEIHLDNERMRAVAKLPLTERIATMREDIASLRQAVIDGLIQMPVALHGESMFVPPDILGIGYETRPLEPGVATAFKRFFFAGLVMLYDRRGWAAVKRNARRRPHDLWLGGKRFLEG